MAQPTLSVLIPNYNHSRFLPESLQAILDQTLKPLEIIIVDDCSTDDSVEIIEKIMLSHPHVRLIRNQENIGVVKNMNKLLELATGDYVCYAAADDRVQPGFFEKSMNLLSQYPQAGICSSLSYKMDEKGKITGIFDNLTPARKDCYFSPQKIQKILLKRKFIVNGNTVVYNRKALVEAGGFSSELEFLCDGFMHILLSLKHGSCFIPEPLGCFRFTEGNFSTNCISDTGRNARINSDMLNLIKTKYPGVFPKEYIFNMELTIRWSELRDEQNRIFNETIAPALSGNFLPDKLFAGSIRLIWKMQTLFLLAYMKLRVVLRRK